MSEKNRTKELKECIISCGMIADDALYNGTSGEGYKDELLHLLRIMKVITPEEIKAVGYPFNIQNTLLMDRHLIDDTITEEIDQLSLLSTVVTYIFCNSDGRSGHSKAYMDRVTALRKILENVYDKEAIRFCGSDDC